MTEKRFTWDSSTIAIRDNQEKEHYYIDITCIDEVVELLNELHDENKELKDKNSQLQETLAFRSNQLALMERLVDDLGSEEMVRQMEEILNDLRNKSR